MASAEKQAKMKEQFDKLDSNGDGTLDLPELAVLLRKGNPNFTDAEVKSLYDACDTNHDGRVTLEEFMGYIYKQDKKGGRHDRLHAAGGVVDDGTEGAGWGGCEHTFTEFAGKDMDGKEFMKFVKDSGLLGHGFSKTDVDLCFAKVVPKGKRRMDFNCFKDACRVIAQKRGQSTGEVMAKVASANGPVLSGTKTEYSKFYDDKSTYTGAATNNDFLGGDPNHGQGRHEAQQAAADAALHSGAPEGDWGPTEATFNAFAGSDGIDGREFLKMCDDIGLLNKKFAKTDVDLVFAGVARKAKKIQFAEFKDCVRKIAQKRGEAIPETQAKIAACSGPTLHGTKTDAVRFYDDKSTYTGAASEVFQREGGHGADRHAALAAEAAAKAGASEDEHPWEPVLQAYFRFAGDDGIDGREFAKLCQDCDLYDKNFSKNDVDIVFVKAAGKGVRKLNDQAFCAAVRGIAVKKGCATSKVQGAVANSSGPVMHATKAEYSKFHDDKSTYTGTKAED